MKSTGKNILIIYTSILLTIPLFYACISENEDALITPEEESLEINLRWFSGSFEQSKEEMQIGMQYALSYLGAQLPKGSFNDAVTNISENIFTLDLSKVGFNEEAQNTLQKIVTRIKRSAAYQQNDYTEAGRFIMLTLNSSYHYFKITGIPESIEAFRSLHSFSEGRTTRVINSAISDVNRLIEVSDASRAEEIAYISAEGGGEFEDNSFQLEEFEVMDYMPNGQFRYGLYDMNGKLKAAADSRLTRAGKPAKCQWCHEIGIQPFFRDMPVLPGEGYLSKEEFLDIRSEFTLFMVGHRAELNSEIDFTERQHHALMEHIYIDFMEPDVERLAIEWNLSLETTMKLVENLDTHTQEEFGFENLYDRNEVDRLAPYLTLEVPQSAREFSVNEPDFFK